MVANITLSVSWHHAGQHNPIGQLASRLIKCKRPVDRCVGDRSTRSIAINYAVMAYIVMAYIGMAYIVMPHIVMADIGTAYVVTAYIGT